MKGFLSHPLLLITFFIITTIFAWVSGGFSSDILTKISIFNVVLIDAIISFIFLLLTMLLTNHSFENIKKDFKLLSKKEIILFILFGILSSFFGIWSTTMSKYHSVGKIEMMGFFISLIVGGIALHLTNEKKMNFSRILGIVIIAFGGYLLIRE